MSYHISYRIVSYCILSNRIVSYHTMSYHISNHVVSYRIVKYLIVSYRIILYPIISCHIIYHIVLYRIVSYRIVSYHIIPCHIIHQIISYRIVKYLIVSYILYPIISYHILSYCILSYLIISYIISCHISYRIVLYLIVSYHIIPCHIYQIISYLIVKYLIVSYHIISYHIINETRWGYLAVSFFLQMFQAPQNMENFLTLWGISDTSRSTLLNRSSQPVSQSSSQSFKSIKGERETRSPHVTPSTTETVIFQIGLSGASQHLWGFTPKHSSGRDANGSCETACSLINWHSKIREQNKIELAVWVQRLTFVRSIVTTVSVTRFNRTIGRSQFDVAVLTECHGPDRLTAVLATACGKGVAGSNINDGILSQVWNIYWLSLSFNNRNLKLFHKHTQIACVSRVFTHIDDAGDDDGLLEWRRLSTLQRRCSVRLYFLGGGGRIEGLP